MDEQIEKLKKIHYDFIAEFPERITDWNRVKEILSTYNKPNVDPNELKTILTVTSSLRDRPEIKELWYEMNNLLKTLILNMVTK